MAQSLLNSTTPGGNGNGILRSRFIDYARLVVETSRERRDRGIATLPYRVRPSSRFWRPSKSHAPQSVGALEHTNNKNNNTYLQSTQSQINKSKYNNNQNTQRTDTHTQLQKTISNPKQTLDFVNFVPTSGESSVIKSAVQQIFEEDKDFLIYYDKSKKQIIKTTKQKLDTETILRVNDAPVVKTITGDLLPVISYDTDKFHSYSIDINFSQVRDMFFLNNSGNVVSLKNILRRSSLNKKLLNTIFHIQNSIIKLNKRQKSQNQKFASAQIPPQIGIVLSTLISTKTHKKSTLVLSKFKRNLINRYKEEILQSGDTNNTTQTSRDYTYAQIIRKVPTKTKQNNEHKELVKSQIKENNIGESSSDLRPHNVKSINTNKDTTASKLQPTLTSAGVYLNIAMLNFSKSLSQRGVYISYIRSTLKLRSIRFSDHTFRMMAQNFSFDADRLTHSEALQMLRHSNPSLNLTMRYDLLCLSYSTVDMFEKCDIRTTSDYTGKRYSQSVLTSLCGCVVPLYSEHAKQVSSADMWLRFVQPNMYCDDKYIDFRNIKPIDLFQKEKTFSLISTTGSTTVDQITFLLSLCPGKLLAWLLQHRNIATTKFNLGELSSTIIRFKSVLNEGSSSKSVKILTNDNLQFSFLLYDCLKFETSIKINGSEHKLTSISLSLNIGEQYEMLSLDDSKLLFISAILIPLSHYGIHWCSRSLLSVLLPDVIN